MTRYMTKDELASMLRVSVRTVTTYMAQGLLPQPLQLGRRLLWEQGAVIQFIQPKPVLANNSSGPVKRGRPRKVIAV
jgi:predicted DNA-binding transcriptional regulator AlpA